MNILKIAAFSIGDEGGNPAGVCLTGTAPPEADMARIAREVGFSETAFSWPEGDVWRTRYFSPESEVPFCGHATIALGSALAMEHGEGGYRLMLNQGEIAVDGRRDGPRFAASLTSPPSSHDPVPEAVLAGGLALFGLTSTDLADELQPAIIRAGAVHLLLPLASRATLAAMDYELDAGRRFMRAHDLTTICLAVREAPDRYSVRNAFASGGVLEDPATGAAAAALAGYLRDSRAGVPTVITIMQGEDMGMASRITVTIPPTRGSGLIVSGAARVMQ